MSPYNIHYSKIFL